MLDSRYRERLGSNEEFAWIYEDIEEYNKDKDRKTVSLLVDERRTERKESEAKRKLRKEQRYLLHGLPVPIDEDEATAEAKIESSAADTVERNTELEVITNVDSDVEGEGEEDDLPDLILEETARIVADAARLIASKPMFAQDLSKPKAEKETVELMN